jgi:hypothetical protein
VLQAPHSTGNSAPTSALAWVSVFAMLSGPRDALSTRRTSSNTGVIGPRLSSTHHGIDAIIHRINVAPTFAARECASGTDCAFTHAKAFCSCSGCRGGQHVSTCGSPIAIRICCADCCNVGCIYLPTPASPIMQRVVIVPVACGQCGYPPGSDITWGGLSVHKIGYLLYARRCASLSGAAAHITLGRVCLAICVQVAVPIHFGKSRCG